VASQLRLVSGNVGNQSASANAASYWDHAFPTGYVEVWGLQVGNVGNNEDIGLFLHLADPSTTTLDGYLARAVRPPGNDGWDLWRFTNGVGTSIATDYDNTMPSGGQYSLFRRVGNDLEIWDQSAGGNWTNRITVTDSTYTGGYAGIYIGTDDAGYTGFGGGAPVEFIPQIIRYR
jgi:hypothetical protein